MDDFLLLSQGIKLTNVALSIFVAWGVLRVLDKLGGQEFADLWGILRSSPVALGTYLTGRFVGVALLVSNALH